MSIVRNSFIQMSKLTNLKGRINYISSHARQENLYAVYETTDRKFWTELAKCNQEEFKKSGTEGKCIEARELIIALPESFVDYEPDRLLKLFVQGYGYKNVKEFLTEYKASRAEYNNYQSAIARWKQQTGNKVEPDNLKAKLQRKTQEVKERENNRQSHHYRADRGGR